MTQLQILIAEDEDTSAIILECLAQEEGHYVCGVVKNGADVLGAVQRLRPDLVLMDVHLADSISGVSATRNLLRHVSLPVIIISATDSPDDLREISESGALGFIKKPVSAAEFKVALLLASRHHEAMSKLKDSEVLHRSIFDYATVGIYVCHKDGYFLTTNMAYARMLGYAGPAELLRLVRSADIQVYAEEGRRQKLLTGLAQGMEIRDAESLVYGRDGEMLWVSESLVPNLDVNGDFEHYEGVVININDRKRAEAESRLAFSMLQNTVDAIVDRIAVTDLEGYVIMSNKAFNEGMDYLIESGKTPQVWAVPEENHLYARFLAQLERDPEGRGVIRGAMCFGGHVELMDTSISPYRGPDGEVVGAVFVMRPYAVSEGEAAL